MKKRILMILILVLVVTGCREKATSKPEEEPKMPISIYTDETILVKAKIGEDWKLILELENRNEEMLDLTLVDVAFYNDKMELEKTSNSFLKNLKTSTKGYLVIDMPVTKEGKKSNIIKIDIKVRGQFYDTKQVDLYNEHIIAVYEIDAQDPSLMNVTVTNTSKQILDEVELVILYQKNEEIIAANILSLTNLDGKIEQETYVPIIKDSNNQYVKYDKIVFHINSASKAK